MNKRKIAVVTGSRAEYGLLYWLLREIDEDKDLELQLIVTGMHLSDDFGLTYREIEKDGFKVTAKVDLQLSDDSSVGISKSTSLGVVGFAKVVRNLSPDMIVLLGDRFEIFAAAQAAMFARIPIAHIHGGELTEGVIDEALRHAITKMAHLHFPVAEPYRQRIMQMGEDPKRVYNLGTPGLDHLDRACFLTKSPIEKALGFSFGKLNFLVTYHPVTLLKSEQYKGIFSVFKALDKFPQANIIFTKSNADEGGRKIGKLIDTYISQNPSRNMKAFVSLGLLKYISVAKQVDIVIGNSSSGLIEIPHIGVPTVNIGNREKGRLLASSVINCEVNVDAIKHAIDKGLSEDFQKTLKKIETPYEKANASHRIKEVLKSIPLESLIVKRFNDLHFENMK
jgi:UDP-hydrolysing UDP-N-acetyl-D-glucosamine 2-epimerase